MFLPSVQSADGIADISYRKRNTISFLCRQLAIAKSSMLLVRTELGC